MWAVGFGIVAILAVQMILAGAGIVVLFALTRVKGDVNDELGELREFYRDRNETEQKLLEIRGDIAQMNAKISECLKDNFQTRTIAKECAKNWDEIDARFRSLKASIASNSRRGKRDVEQTDLEELAEANPAMPATEGYTIPEGGLPQNQIDFSTFGKRKAG